MVVCQCCELEISPARLAAVPNAEYCTICQKIQGDVPKVTGYMSWAHKTAPELIVGPQAEILRSYDRQGFHAQLPLSSHNNIFIKQFASGHEYRNLSEQVKHSVGDVRHMELEPSLPQQSASRCHPGVPRINPAGDCLDCALAKQRKRVRG